MTDPYGGMQQQDPYKQAILSQLKGGPVPPGAANPRPPTPFYSPGSMSDPGGGYDPNGPLGKTGPDGYMMDRNGNPIPDSGPGGIAGPGRGADGGIIKAPESPSAPTYAPPNANPGFVPSGWDAGKWNDPGKHDLKYDLGHMLAGISDQSGQISPVDVQKIAPQLEAMGIKWDGGDGLTMPDGNRVDFIKGMKAGGGKGQLNWLDSTMQGGQPWAGKSPTATLAPTPPTSNINDPTVGGPDQNSDLWQRIMAQLQSGGQTVTGGPVLPNNGQNNDALISQLKGEDNPNPQGSDAYYEWENQHKAPMSLATWSKNPATGKWGMVQ